MFINQLLVFWNYVFFLQTKLYTEDWIGLKTLDAAGKVKFVSVPGEHLQMAHDDVVKHVVPYLQNHPSFFLNADSTKI